MRLSASTMSLLVGCLSLATAFEGPPPDGPMVAILNRNCDEKTPGLFIPVEQTPVIWAPGQCQADPFGLPTSTIKLQCVKDGSLWVQFFESGTCGGQARANIFIRHGFKVRDVHFGALECTQFWLSDTITRACGPTARPTEFVPTAPPTTASPTVRQPTASPTTLSPTPEPTTVAPTAAPGPDVYCSTYNDPHVEHFDGSVVDYMSRGHFVFYKTDVMEVQTRHGPYLTLDPSHHNYDVLSTNNAFVLTGSFVCGALVEVYAFRPADLRSKVGEGSLRILKNGHHFYYENFEEMMAAKRQINELVCGVFDFDLTYDNNKFGPIWSIEKEGRNFSWHIRPFGVNLWTRFSEDLYLDTDSGLCTKRGDYERILECEEIIFETFPDSHTCAEEKENDRDIPAPENPECDADLEREATEICGACPDLVEPRDCVVETCLLGAIKFAKAQVVACGAMEAPPVKNTCGRLGAFNGKRRSFKAGRQASACACMEACAARGGEQWSFKGKRGRCKCYSEVEHITFLAGDASRTNRLVVGVL